MSTSATAGGECARYAERLGAYARGSLRTRAERGLRRHMAECARCRVAAAEVKDLNERLRSLVPLALIGWFAAGGAKGLAGLAVGGGAAGAAAGAGTAAASGGAASEGVGGPVKAGIAAGVLTAASVAVALVLVADGGTPPPTAHTAPSAAPVAPASPSAPPPSHRPAPPTPVEAAPDPSTPAPAPSEQPVQAASRAEPQPTPTPPPEKPEPSPPPSSSPPPPAPVVFPLHTLAWAPFARQADDVHAPTLRSGGFSGVWQRDGLSIGGTHYAHGVTVPAPSSATIDLNRECAAFDALAGVDDLALRAGSVTFAVYGDGKRLWSSAPLRGGRSAVPVHVPLDGVSTLRLTTTPRGLLGVTGAADWASARISCR